MHPAGLFCTNLKKAVDNSPFSWYNNTRRQGRHRLWGISSAGSPVGIKTHPQSDSPATIKFPTKELHPRGSLLGFYGGLAQLGERLHGMQEVSGSIPLFSTKKALYFV